MFLLGQTLSPYKRVIYALQKFPGIGPSTSQRICSESFVHPQCHVNELSDFQLERLKPLVHACIETFRQEKNERERRMRNRIEPIPPR